MVETLVIRKKGIWDEGQRKTWSENHQAIIEAVRKIERRREKGTFSEIRRQLMNDRKGKKGKGLSDPTISDHLKRAVRNRKLVKKGRAYSSIHKVFSDSILTSMILSEILHNIPFPKKSLEDFVSRSSATYDKDIEELEKKCKNPIGRFRYGKELEELYQEKQLLRENVYRSAYKDFNYIKKATDFNVFSSKRFQKLDVSTIVDAVTGVLLKVFRHERRLAQSKGEKFSMEDSGLVITIRFDPDPKKIGEPPTHETVLDWVKSQGKLDPMGIMYSKEYLEQVRQTESNLQEWVLDAEKTDQKYNPLGWDIPCPHYFGYLAQKPIAVETPKDCFNCPKYEECCKKQ